MKTLLKIVLGLVSILVIVVIGGIVYLNSAFPDVSDAPEISIERTPERIARGEYLALHVSMCIECHSERDYSRFAGPVVAGSHGKGGELFGEQMGFPGNFYAPNLTPANLSEWTDGELYRSITAGVTRDGRPLFPIMPYVHFGKMTREDVYSIIAYLRNLEPIENDIPESEANFPMNLIMRTIPRDGQPAERIPDPTDLVAYGGYMINAAGCTDCHTPMEKGEFIEGMEYAGGNEFPLPAGTVRSMNITPDEESGIGGWTEEMFVGRFRSYADSVYVDEPLAPTDYNSIMPWRMYAGMTDLDLRAIFAYLMHEVKPVSNTVERFTPVGSNGQ
ncbi:cytochrome C [bacterium]|nr:cytochrome C [bacterium]